MNYVIVEPHADDAFLSAHGHILSWIKQGHAVHIVTLHMSDNPVRLVEAKALFNEASPGHSDGSVSGTRRFPHQARP